MTKSNQLTWKCKNQWSWDIQGITFQLHGGTEDNHENLCRKMSHLWLKGELYYGSV
jgi:hypothetical protein